MKLLNYSLSVNTDGTYRLNYDYIDENNNTIHVKAPKVDVNYDMEPLRNREDIIFPNIKGLTVLEDEKNNLLNLK